MYQFYAIWSNQFFQQVRIAIWDQQLFFHLKPLFNPVSDCIEWNCNSSRTARFLAKHIFMYLNNSLILLAEQSWKNFMQIMRWTRWYSPVSSWNQKHIAKGFMTLLGIWISLNYDFFSLHIFPFAIVLSSFIKLMLD